MAQLPRRLTRRQALKGLLGGAMVAAASGRGQTLSPTRYPYSSGAFTCFIEDSYLQAPAATPAFRAWLEARYQEAYDHPLRSALQAQRTRLRSASVEQARMAALWLHRAVKTLIPRFSLERGFEFYNAVRLGERQCLLQSVLLAGLLQELGLPAGVVMVWRNQAGQESNLGHAVTLLSLPDRSQVLVDASDPLPFMRHTGLYLWDVSAQGYRFVEPRFSTEGHILGYRRSLDGQALKGAAVRPLDIAFLHSQFDFYRGERAPRGFIGPSTPEGLSVSARFMERAVKRQPQNPLAVYGLGYIYRKQGRLEAAKAQFRDADRLYTAQGYRPAGLRSALEWAGL
ncbi:tetratricopeptide repeat protein [Meiothermus sp. CFH 77666]|uniref:tetratricopeptide repeat protein n=1 Tax=Meiothermus sp. CFH 77666 TaxID=2817942 RepID=UPI001AA013E1|nr:tetratricopeptide repeat protein [Meiothermus sp. CFH 77666]MBO1438775.1 hypothetical protein [Meiothermus sp. CFH 77666]